MDDANTKRAEKDCVRTLHLAVFNRTHLYLAEKLEKAIMVLPVLKNASSDLLSGDSVEDLSNALSAYRAELSTYNPSTATLFAGTTLIKNLATLRKHRVIDELYKIRNRAKEITPLTMIAERLHRFFLPFEATNRLIHLARSQSILAGIELYYIPGDRRHGRTMHCESKLAVILDQFRSVCSAQFVNNH